MALLHRLAVLGVVGSLGVVALLPVREATGASSQGGGNAPIRQEMGGLFVAVSEFLPLVLSKSEFENPKNAREIASLMNRLKDLSGKMAASSRRFADNDPSIPFIAEKFNEDVRMSIDMWNAGDRVIPRRLMRNVTDYCISCHTRTSKGLHLSDVIQSQRFKSMPSLAKAEYLAATRQFEDALKHYEHVLVDKPLAKTDPEAWSLAVRKMMAISVRVQKDSSLTTDLLSKIQDSPDSIPASMRPEIASWRQSAKAWMGERRPASMTDQERFELAKRLVAEGDDLATKIEGGALIEYMRASAIMHDLLGRLKDSPQMQEMLWIAGKSSEQVRDLNMWTMQDVYYEGCIRKGKDKTLAGRCLAALESSLLRTYGAAGRSGLPEFTKKQLDELGKLTK